MNSNNPMRNYKHDICGKFRDINTAIDSLGEDAFNNPENYEIFHAVHELLLKMVKTSRNTIAQNIKQDIVLVVSDRTPDLSLPKLHIEGVSVRIANTEGKMNYIYSTAENDGDHKSKIAVVSSLLPILEYEYEKSEEDLNNYLRVEI